MRYAAIVLLAGLLLISLSINAAYMWREERLVWALQTTMLNFLSQRELALSCKSNGIRM